MITIEYLETLSDQELLDLYHKTKTESELYGVLQNALKVCANSGFGAIANEHFMFFDNRMAESITATGQFIIQFVGNGLSDHATKIIGTQKDRGVYQDTDSCYVHYGELVNKYFAGMDEQKIADALDKFVKAKVDPELTKLTDEIKDRMNFARDTISFKREAISSAGVFTGKKRYMQRVLDNEGVRYAEPDYKVTGIETNRSSTPDVARGWLMDAIKILLDTNDRTQFVNFVESMRSEFCSLSPEEIAFPRSANNIAKYIDSVSIYKKGIATPIAVRASLLYNNLLKQHGLDRDMQPIQEGDKMKFIYLKEPNPLRENVIGFVDVLPKKFDLHRYVDYDTQFEKVFLAPLEKIATAVSWSLEDESSLEDFFG